MATGSGKTVVVAMAIVIVFECPPRRDLAAYQPSMLERIKSLRFLVAGGVDLHPRMNTNR
jgi:hypothetical protein